MKHVFFLKSSFWSILETFTIKSNHSCRYIIYRSHGSYGILCQNNMSGKKNHLNINQLYTHSFVANSKQVALQAKQTKLSTKIHHPCIRLHSLLKYSRVNLTNLFETWPLACALPCGKNYERIYPKMAMRDWRGWPFIFPPEGEYQSTSWRIFFRLFFANVFFPTIYDIWYIWESWWFTWKDSPSWICCLRLFFPDCTMVN